MDIKDGASVKMLLDKFYARASKDSLLKPTIARLKDSGFLNERLYKYWQDAILNDVAVEEANAPEHIQLMPSTRHFFRWLTIFFQTVNELYLGPNAEKAKVLVIRRAEQFQSSLGMGGF